MSLRWVKCIWCNNGICDMCQDDDRCDGSIESMEECAYVDAPTLDDEDDEWE